MKAKQAQLISVLGPETASAFGGGSAGANVGLIQRLPENEKFAARQAFASSLSTMWIFYVACSALGLAISCAIGKNKLDKLHEETKTGLDVEKLKRAEREAERAERRRKRASKGSLPLDPEASGENVGSLGVADPIEEKEAKA